MPRFKHQTNVKTIRKVKEVKKLIHIHRDIFIENVLMFKSIMLSFT